MEYRARFSAAADKLASWFSGWEGVHRPMQALAGCSAKLGHGYRNNFWQLSNSCSSHLDDPGEPWGATWRPRGRPRRPPEGPDAPWTAPTRIPDKERG